MVERIITPAIRVPKTWRARVAGVIAMRLMRLALRISPDTFAQAAEFWVNGAGA